MINLLKEYQAEISKLSVLFDKTTPDNPLTLESGYLGHPYARCLIPVLHLTFDYTIANILTKLIKTMPNVFTEEFQAMTEQERGTWLTTTVMGEPHSLIEVAEPEAGTVYYCHATVNVVGIEQNFTDGENEGGAVYSNDELEIICLWSEETGYLIFNELFVSLPEERVISKQLFKIIKE
jgi:hypothetical protein